MIKAIIFDCFGVIRIDSFDNVYEQFGGNVQKDKEFITQTLYDGNSGKIPSSAEAFAKQLGITADEWGIAISKTSVIQQDVLDYATELRKKYKTGLLSNIGKGGLQRIFDPGLLEKYFDVIVGSGDIGFAKPEAEAYEIVADMLGVRLDECVFIDDRQPYVDGALRVGMEAILFKSLDQLKPDLNTLLQK